MQTLRQVSINSVTLENPYPVPALSRALPAILDSQPQLSVSRTSHSSVSGRRGPSLLLNSWGRDKPLWNLHWKEIQSSPSCWVPLIPSRRIQLFVRGTANPSREEKESYMIWVSSFSLLFKIMVCFCVSAHAIITQGSRSQGGQKITLRSQSILSFHGGF